MDLLQSVTKLLLAVHAHYTLPVKRCKAALAYDIVSYATRPVFILRRRALS